LSDPTKEFYELYLRAIEIFNGEVDKLRSAEAREVFRLKTRSPLEFAEWWACIREYPDLARRWTERFNDPEGSLERERQEIISMFDQIRLGRRAA